MRLSVRKVLATAVLSAACTAWSHPALAVTDITAVDIQVIASGTPGILMVQIRPNAPLSSADGVLNLTFTLRWPTSSGGSADDPDQFSPPFAAPFCFGIGANLSQSPDG